MGIFLKELVKAFIKKVKFILYDILKNKASHYTLKIIVANFLFCHGTGYHLAHIPGICLVGVTSLNNVCKFEKNNIF